MVNIIINVNCIIKCKMVMGLICYVMFIVIYVNVYGVYFLWYKVVRID